MVVGGISGGSFLGPLGENLFRRGLGSRKGAKYAKGSGGSYSYRVAVDQKCGTAIFGSSVFSAEEMQRFGRTLSGLGHLMERVTRACARGARFCPGYYIAGLQPFEMGGHAKAAKDAKGSRANGC